MFRFLLKKAPSVLLVLFSTSLVAFLLPRLTPGDPAQTVAGAEATAEQVEVIREAMGLDKPLVVQYFDWLGGVLSGDFGDSYILKRPIIDLISSRVWSTVELALVSTVFMVLFSLVLGYLAGTSKSKLARGIIDSTNALLVATPAFLSGLILILVFGIHWRLLPVSGEVSLLEDFGIGIQYLLLPSIALGLALAPGVARLLQTTMVSTRGEEFVDLAKAKGASSWVINTRHILRTSLGAAVVALGLRIGELLGGAIIIEAIFARNGLGQLAVQAVASRDYYLVQILVMGAVLIAVISQLLSEIILAALDPRVRLEA